jgi:hypothetical protein
MRARLITAACALAVASAATGASVAGAHAPARAASSPAVSQIRAVYRTVLTAEYFGTASAECSRLTAAGVKSFTGGGMTTCTKAFDAQQHGLKHKIKDDDNSGYTPSQWRSVVASVMAHLKVSVHGSHASAIGGQSGIPGLTNLIRVNGKWLFNSFPPSVQS